MVFLKSGTPRHASATHMTSYFYLSVHKDSISLPLVIASKEQIPIEVARYISGDGCKMARPVFYKGEARQLCKHWGLGHPDVKGKKRKRMQSTQGGGLLFH